MPEAPPEAERAPPEAVPQLTDALGLLKSLGSFRILYEPYRFFKILEDPFGAMGQWGNGAVGKLGNGAMEQWGNGAMGQ